MTGSWPVRFEIVPDDAAEDFAARARARRVMEAWQSRKRTDGGVV